MSKINQSHLYVNGTWLMVYFLFFYWSCHTCIILSWHKISMFYIAKKKKRFHFSFGHWWCHFCEQHGNREWKNMVNLLNWQQTKHLKNPEKNIFNTAIEHCACIIFTLLYPWDKWNIPSTAPFPPELDASLTNTVTEPKATT